MKENLSLPLKAIKHSLSVSGGHTGYKLAYKGLSRIPLKPEKEAKGKKKKEEGKKEEREKKETGLDYSRKSAGTHAIFLRRPYPSPIIVLQFFPRARPLLRAQRNYVWLDRRWNNVLFLHITVTNLPSRGHRLRHRSVYHAQCAKIKCPRSWSVSFLFSRRHALPASFQNVVFILHRGRRRCSRRFSDLAITPDCPLLKIILQIPGYQG